MGEVYVAARHPSVPRPPKELKGFVKVSLSPGETKAVQVPLNARAFCLYDEKAKQWRADEGSYQVLVGSSSEKIELSGELKVDKSAVVP